MSGIDSVDYWRRRRRPMKKPQNETMNNKMSNIITNSRTAFNDFIMPKNNIDGWRAVQEEIVAVWGDRAQESGGLTSHNYPARLGSGNASRHCISGYFGLSSKRTNLQFLESKRKDHKDSESLFSCIVLRSNMRFPTSFWCGLRHEVEKGRTCRFSKWPPLMECRRQRL